MIICNQSSFANKNGSIASRFHDQDTNSIGIWKEGNKDWDAGRIFAQKWLLSANVKLFLSVSLSPVVFHTVKIIGTKSHYWYIRHDNNWFIHRRLFISYRRETVYESKRKSCADCCQFNPTFLAFYWCMSIYSSVCWLFLLSVPQWTCSSTSTG
jgi:hypothetical protein